jgi:hypothetical protein
VLVVTNRPQPGREGLYCGLGSQVNYCWGGTICTPSSPGFSEGICCFPGRVNCGGRCCDPCPAGQQQDCATCNCGPVCSPCPAYGQVQDPQTCQCSCSDRKEIPCNGVCIDPLTDPTFCGGCPGRVCNPYNQSCCNGACTDIGSDLNCTGACDQVPAGWKCCEQGGGDFQPAQLGTKQNCRWCGEECVGGRDCTAMGCQCPPGRIECGVCCPPTHQGCCNSTCINLQMNTSHCGSCGNDCPTGARCINGVCTCPTGTRPCGNQCWPTNQLCCSDTPCPANSTDCCNGRCQDYMSVGSGQGWAAWRAMNPNAPWATCTNGVFTCHPDLPQYRTASGLSGCCPPKTTYSEVSGGGACCPPGKTFNPVTGLCQ